jgi:hypothetical protein
MPQYIPSSGGMIGEYRIGMTLVGNGKAYLKVTSRHMQGETQGKQRILSQGYGCSGRDSNRVQVPVSSSVIGLLLVPIYKEIFQRTMVIMMNDSDFQKW